VGVLIDRNLASQTGEGSMAAMRFATTLVQFPLGLVGSAVAFAVLPTLSRHAAAGPAVTGGGQYKATLARGISMVLMLIVPASVGLAVLREPLVRLLFQHGAFDAQATARTALAFLCYSPSIPFAAVDQLLIFAFYARQNTVTPVLVGVLGVAVYLSVAMTLLPALGMAGLALANSAQWIVHAVVLLALLWRAIGGLRGYGLGWSTLKVVAAGLVMGLAVLAAQPALGALTAEAGLAGQVLELAALVGLGLAAYAGLAFALRLEEAGWAWRLVVDKLRQGRRER
jgi:putative peptidoglycan lipid II flippase